MLKRHNVQRSKTIKCAHDQIEEPMGVLEETTINDVTNYADWSTFDGES